jgi:hypothetical protein
MALQQAVEGHRAVRRRDSHFIHSRHTDAGEVVSLRRQPRFTDQERFQALISV